MSTARKSRQTGKVTHITFFSKKKYIPDALYKWGPGHADLKTWRRHQRQMWRKHRDHFPPNLGHLYRDLTTEGRITDLKCICTINKKCYAGFFFNAQLLWCDTLTLQFLYVSTDIYQSKKPNSYFITME